MVVLSSKNSYIHLLPGNFKFFIILMDQASYQEDHNIIAMTIVHSSHILVSVLASPSFGVCNADGIFRSKQARKLSTTKPTGQEQRS
jgi:hypothetical protein